MKVRSAIATMLALGVGAAAVIGAPQAAFAKAAEEPAAAGSPGPEAASRDTVTIAVLPRGTDPAGVAGISPRLATGTLSAGLGSVPADQTYLDVGQGNRLFDSLYPDPLPPLYVVGSRVPPGQWSKALERAADAPAEIVPGLLADELREAGVPVGAAPSAREAALIAAGSDGVVERRPECGDGPAAGQEECPGLTVLGAEPEEVPGMISAQEPGDLLIAIERPPPVGRLLAIGVAGDGFDGGVLRSATTRIDGYVLSTDLAPTVLEHFGLAVPDEVSGEAIDAIPDGDRDSVSDLEERLEEISPRRHPVLGVNVAIWVGLAALAALLFRGRGARIALPALAATVAWVPALLLAGALLEPSVLAERLIIGIGGPALALLSLWAFRRLGRPRAMYAAFALAALASIALTALDVLAGSPLTSLSLIGPNPGLGVRFFGIGNELEAAIGVLLALGGGAAVTAVAPADPRRSVAIVVAAAAVIGVLVFAPGRFGADVGAAITFPAAAAGVALAALGLRGGRGRLVLFVAAPILALAALVAIDLAIGGDAHLSRSVLDAGGLDQLGDVIERRVRLSAASFGRFFDSLVFSIALGLMIVGILARKPILGWLDPFPAARAGLIGAVVAAVIGALANDSGSLLLMIATAYVAAFTGLGFSAHYFTSDSKAR